MAECEDALTQQRYDHLLQLLTDKVDVILSKVDDAKGTYLVVHDPNLALFSSTTTDLECCINHMCHLISRAPTADAAAQLAARLASKSEPHAEARLTGLAELYNVAADPALRRTILLHILRYALTTNQADAVAPSLSQLLAAWLDGSTTLPAAQQRELLLLAADVLRASKRRRGQSREAFALLVRCLDLLDGASAAEVAAVKPAAHAAVLDFLGAADLFHFDVWDSPAVQQLANDAATADAFALLRILVAGSVKDFDAFAASPKAATLCGELGVDIDTLRDKAHVMGVAALAADRQQLSFADVQVRHRWDFFDTRNTPQASLGIAAEEVEPLLVRAIGRGLVEGRLDQLSGSVRVTHAASRSFGKAQWEDLRVQLADWRERLHAMQDSVAAQQLAQPVAT